MHERIEALSLDQLAELTTPTTVAGGQSQAVPWVFYDSLAYVSTVTREQTFFQAVLQDKTLSNMQGAGQLPSKHYFRIMEFYIDPLIVPSSSATGLTGAWNDMAQLMYFQHPTFEFNMSDKRTGPFPATFAHGSGNVGGYGYSEAVTTVAGATVINERATWGDGKGYWIGGSIIIPPLTAFSMTLTWTTAATLTVDNPLIRMNMRGILQRTVL